MPCNHNPNFRLMGAKNGCCACCELESQAKNNKKLKVAIKDLVTTLRELYDHQNGPPLPKYEEGWGEAMKKARELINKYEEI